MANLDTKMAILVVDDFATMRRIVSNMLNQLEFKNIDEAENGAEALRKIEQKQYDLLLVDWNMPKMSGLELLSAARKMDNYKKTPIIMVTAEALKENILAAVQAGATGYVVKPFNAATLEDKLKHAFRAS